MYNKQREENFSELLWLRKRCLNTTRIGSRKMMSVYTSIYPNKTEYNINAPEYFWRKFSPDGKYLVGFKTDLTGVGVYRLDKTSINNNESEADNRFTQMFTPVWDKNLVENGEVLSRDFLLFVSGGKRILVASTKMTRESPRKTQCDLPGTVFLEDITFFVLDLENGKTLSKKVFIADYINLQGHSGVSLYQDLLSIISVKYQSLYIVRILPDGGLMDAMEIGWNLFDDDQLVQILPQQPEEEKTKKVARLKRKRNARTAFGEEESPGMTTGTETEANPRPILRRRLRVEVTTLDGSDPVSYILHHNNFITGDRLNTSRSGLYLLQDRNNDSNSTFFGEEQRVFSGIKQRMLSFLYKQALKAQDPLCSLMNFYSQFAKYENMMLWKSQFINRNVVLLKFGIFPHVCLRQSHSINSSALSPSVFMIYNILTTQVYTVMENSSKAFLEFCESNFDSFYYPMTSTFLLQSEYALTSTLANEVVCREYNEHIRENMSLARHLGSAQATRKFLSFLPFPPQFTCDSFYFDHSLFKPIPRVRNAIEQHRPTSFTLPVCFYGRKSGQLKFNISPMAESQTPLAGLSRFSSVSYIVHPFLPIFLSTLHTQNQVNANLFNIHFHQ